ncbi:hypothetical protein VKP35_03465 [Streptococcus pyogenes]|nr:hypothetical protein [Streptococcus pyogenes]WSE60468.1 hypothetical protein VKP35_03465 [Streptococcus pyogenes]
MFAKPLIVLEIESITPFTAEPTLDTKLLKLLKADFMPFITAYDTLSHIFAKQVRKCPENATDFIER